MRLNILPNSSSFSWPKWLSIWHCLPGESCVFHTHTNSHFNRKAHKCDTHFAWCHLGAWLWIV